MKTRLTGSLRTLSERIVEKTLHVTVHREPPFGSDPYFAVSRLRPWSPTDVVFDVGANDGRTIPHLRRHLGAPRIYAFEPVAATYQKLVASTVGLENVRCLPLALGSARGPKTMFRGRRPATSSFSPEWSESRGTEQVEVSTLDEVVDEHGIDFIHFLKLDTEGHELEVLRGAHATLAASRIAIIQAEVGFDTQIAPHTPLESIRAHLAPLGYVLHGLFQQQRSGGRVTVPVTWSAGESSGYRPSVLKFCDAVFVRADRAQGRQFGA